MYYLYIFYRKSSSIVSIHYFLEFNEFALSFSMLYLSFSLYCCSFFLANPSLFSRSLSFSHFISASAQLSFRNTKITSTEHYFAGAAISFDTENNEASTNTMDSTLTKLKHWQASIDKANILTRTYFLRLISMSE